MDPITLITAGPALLRMVGGLFGGKTKEVAENVAGVVDSVRGLPQAIAKQKVEQHLATLPPESLLALKQVEVRLAEIERDREANRLAAETAQHQQTQETARTEAQSNDEYVRRTRPKIARDSALVTFAYTFLTAAVFPVANQVYGQSLPTAPDAAIIAVLFSPCLTYMGARTIDKIKGKN